MGEISIRKKIRLCASALVLLGICLTIYVLYLFDRTDNSRAVAVKAKIEFAALVEELESGNTVRLQEYSALYVSNDGIIRESTIKEYPRQERVNLHRFSSLNGRGNVNDMDYFQSPVIQNGVQAGTLIVKYDALKYTIFERYGIVPFLPVLALVTGIIVLLFIEYRSITRDILQPFEELGRVTKRILKQDYETRLEYDYTGEIGELCHDFEMLRDELYHTRKSEEQLKRSEKELLACISHDLKTPLASVSGYVEGIRSNVVTSREEVDRYLDIIIKKVRFIAKLIDDILEQSKTELNEFTVNLKEVYAKELLGEIFDEISIDTAKSGYEFICDEILNVMVYADKERLLQVVQNIVSNAMKYMEKGGTITSKIGVYEDEMVIALSDNGKGITVSDIPFVFDKFYRGEKARTLNVPGSGLGLYIAKYIVERHGGRIECDSVLNQGTTIRFSIKLC